MANVRVIPVLLLKNTGLVKTVKFKNSKYVGDPINAVRIFNEKEVDELVFLDIEAGIKNIEPNYKIIKDIASECFMPLSYGGGITNITQVKKLFSLGIEKVVLNTAAIINPNLINEIADIYGSQSVVVSIDVKKSFLGKFQVMYSSGTKVESKSVRELITEIQERGAGEVIVHAIDRDGTQNGFDLDLIRIAAEVTRVPLVALGGASNLYDLKKALDAGATAVAAGSFFIFHGRHRAVLISYPSIEELNKLFNS